MKCARVRLTKLIIWGSASYDYGAPIAENRDLTTKFDELKRQGLFLRSSPEFYKTDFIGNSSSGAVTINSAAVFGVHLKNPDTNTSFYIVRQTDSTSTWATIFLLLIRSLVVTWPP